MTIRWRRSDDRSEYYYGDIAGSKVSAQIGRSTSAGQYVWIMFHEDIGCAIHGGEAGSLEDAKRDALGWVTQWVKR